MDVWRVGVVAVVSKRSGEFAKRHREYEYSVVSFNHAMHTQQGQTRLENDADFVALPPDYAPLCLHAAWFDQVQ